MEKEVKQQLPPEKFACIPYSLLNERQKEVLQYTADGFTEKQISEALGVSVSSVEGIRLKTGWFGERNKVRREPIPIVPTFMSLIQDGINMGYVTHELESGEEFTINWAEKHMLDSISNGLTFQQIGNNLGVSTVTVSTKYDNLQRKFGTNNHYHTVARFTELKRRGLLKVVKTPRPKRHSKYYKQISSLEPDI